MVSVVISSLSFAKTKISANFLANAGFIDHFLCHWLDKLVDIPFQMPTLEISEYLHSFLCLSELECIYSSQYSIRVARRVSRRSIIALWTSVFCVLSALWDKAHGATKNISDNAFVVSRDCRSKALVIAPHIPPTHVAQLSYSSTPKHTKKPPCAQQES